MVRSLNSSSPLTPHTAAFPLICLPQQLKSAAYPSSKPAETTVSQQRAGLSRPTVTVKRVGV